MLIKLYKDILKLCKCYVILFHLLLIGRFVLDKNKKHISGKAEQIHSPKTSQIKVGRYLRFKWFDSPIKQSKLVATPALGSCKCSFKSE